MPRAHAHYDGVAVACSNDLGVRATRAIRARTCVTHAWPLWGSVVRRGRDRRWPVGVGRRSMEAPKGPPLRLGRPRRRLRRRLHTASCAASHVRVRVTYSATWPFDAFCVRGLGWDRPLSGSPRAAGVRGQCFMLQHSTACCNTGQPMPVSQRGAACAVRRFACSASGTARGWMHAVRRREPRARDRRRIPPTGACHLQCEGAWPPWGCEWYRATLTRYLGPNATLSR